MAKGTGYTPDADERDRPADNAVSAEGDATEQRRAIDSAVSYLCQEAERLRLASVAAALRHALRLLRAH